MAGEHFSETPIHELGGTPFQFYDKSSWMAYYITQYGYIDGSHHKQWVLDQCLRIHLGAKVLVRIAEWGHVSDENYKSEYRVSLDEPSQRYIDYCEAEEINEEDQGIAP